MQFLSQSLNTEYGDTEYIMEYMGQGLCPKAAILSGKYSDTLLWRSRDTREPYPVGGYSASHLHPVLESAQYGIRIRNTDTEYGIRFVPQSLNTEYGYGIRDTVRAPKPKARIEEFNRAVSCVEGDKAHCGQLLAHCGAQTAFCTLYSVSVFRIWGPLSAH